MGAENTEQPTAGDAGYRQDTLTIAFSHSRFVRLTSALSIILKSAEDSFRKGWHGAMPGPTIFNARLRHHNL
jgi:hypothetical protein